VCQCEVWRNAHLADCPIDTGTNQMFGKRPQVMKWSTQSLLVLGSLTIGCGHRPTNPDSSNPQPPPPAVIHDRSAAWSPTRGEIAYVHVARNSTELARGRYQIWLYDVAAESVRYQAPGFAPTWSPDGDSLLFVDNQNVYMMGRVTRAIAELVVLGEITSVTWSPTAPLLAVTTNYGTPAGAFHIFLVPLSGGPPRDISTINNEGSWHQPRFNPTGDRIVHDRFMQNTIGTELFTMDTTGANATRLTTNQVYDTDGAWSPDGTRIAYSHGSDVWIANADGSSSHRVLDMAGEPSWSSDGQRLVATRYLSNSPSLWTVAPDGSAPLPVPGLP
jgi:Tol biopolymer transport system component